MAIPKVLKTHHTSLRKRALAYPEAWEDFPWGDHVFKVKKKIFLFLHVGDEGLSLSVKLPKTFREARRLPFASPTGYGLGKSGWITAKFAPKDEVPVDALLAWLDESYRAIAPKKLVAAL